jgi:hypothetical protein
MNSLALDRPRLLARALRLEYLTVGWNVNEGVGGERIGADGNDVLGTDWVPPREPPGRPEVA